MADGVTIEHGARPVDAGLLSYTHVIYGLHALSAAIGIFGSASIVGAFLLGVPSIVAVIMNYVRRSEARGTWLESHFTWQIRTFWYAFGWAVAVTFVSIPLAFVVIGIGTFVLGMIALSLWIVYRVVRGWLALKDGRSMPV